MLPLLLGGLSACWAAPADAHSAPRAPEYSLSIVEGVTTLPEDSILSTSGSVSPEAQVLLRIVHNGITVAQDTEEDGSAWLSQVPQVGDVVYLESPAGNVVGSEVYDGLPTLDPTVCAGSTNFSGQRSASMEVEGGYFTLVPHPSYVAHRRGQEAQVTSLNGSAFAGNFLRAPVLGQTLRVVEHLKTELAGGATFTYASETDRPVGSCPVPPAPPPPPPPPALQGSIFKLLRTTIRKLLEHGLSDQVTINQPGTVIQDLYLEGGGRIPAYASARGGHKHRRRPPAVLLARGSATAKSAGTVHVLIHPTPKGRHVLRHRRHVRAELVTTLHSSSGAKLDLGARAITLDR